MEAQPEKSGSSQKQLFFKLGFIVLLILLLLIPVALIQDLIGERETLQRSVEEEVSASWGREQTLYGPVLCIPFEKSGITDGKAWTEKHLLYLSPEDLSINSGIATQIRTKGIFNTVVFEGDNTLAGVFTLNALPHPADIKYQFEEAFLVTGLTDPSAVTQKIRGEWNGAPLAAMPGVKNSEFIKSGFYYPVQVDPNQNQYRFEVNIQVRGTTSMSYLPSGRSTQIKVSSPWPSPSFTGRNLPSRHDITANGFEASWTANEYNRPFPNYWQDNEYQVHEGSEKFGVKLIQTADFYQKNMRSAKYAILVIALSFITFFFFEMMLKIKIHPVQYILIGLSLAIFYALLLSLTEHIGFNLAYLISFAAVVLLISIYAFAIFKKLKPILILTALFSMLYGYIFILLQLEDFALLAGSVGLFLILATVMLLSRKINWYNFNDEL